MTHLKQLLNNNIENERQKDRNKGRKMNKLNLIESKESYTIELSVPGFDKDDFKIELDNFNLSVSLDIDDKMNEAIQYTKREYNYSSFKRSFKLAKYSDIKKIDASYVNGILTIQIPKTKEAIPLPVKSIKIS